MLSVLHCYGVLECLSDTQRVENTIAVKNRRNVKRCSYLFSLGFEEGAGAYPNCIWAKAGYTPGRIASFLFLFWWYYLSMYCEIYRWKSIWSPLLWHTYAQCTWCWRYFQAHLFSNVEQRWHREVAAWLAEIGLPLPIIVNIIPPDRHAGRTEATRKGACLLKHIH